MDFCWAVPLSQIIFLLSRKMNLIARSHYFLDMKKVKLQQEVLGFLLGCQLNPDHFSLFQRKMNLIALSNLLTLKFRIVRNNRLLPVKTLQFSIYFIYFYFIEISFIIDSIIFSELFDLFVFCFFLSINTNYVIFINNNFF